MKIASLEAFPIRADRDYAGVTGMVGTPTRLTENGFDYRVSEVYPTLYSTRFETAVFKLTMDNGLTGWGEVQAPLAPEVACTIARRLLRPIVEGAEFNGTRQEIEKLWWRLYSSMRVRGQTGGFMLDAISGVDLALWDLAGKIHEVPAANLISESGVRTELPAYLSGLAGAANEERVEAAREYWSQGFRIFKLFYDRSEEELFDLIDRLQAAFGSELDIAVDALWRLTEDTATEFGRTLDQRRILWLECPLPPEELELHRALSSDIETPIALGESYRTRYELGPFFQAGVIGWLQPDLGRAGITESLVLAAEARRMGIRVVPHVSIALGPQIAAALHFAAAVPECPLVEFNPKVLEMANCLLGEPITVRGAAYELPRGPGLGVQVDEAKLRELAGSGAE